jgi:hypothetical protein
VLKRNRTGEALLNKINLYKSPAKDGINATPLQLNRVIKPVSQ